MDASCDAPSDPSTTTPTTNLRTSQAIVTTTIPAGQTVVTMATATVTANNGQTVTIPVQGDICRLITVQYVIMFFCTPYAPTAKLLYDSYMHYIGGFLTPMQHAGCNTMMNPIQLLHIINEQYHAL